MYSATEVRIIAFIVLVVYTIAGISIGVLIERTDAIKANAAEYTIDPKTGVTGFKYITPIK